MSDIQGVGWHATAEGEVSADPQPAREVRTSLEDRSHSQCDNCPKKFEGFAEAVDHAVNFGHTTRYVVEHHVVYHPVVVPGWSRVGPTDGVAIATDTAT